MSLPFDPPKNYNSSNFREETDFEVPSYASFPGYRLLASKFTKKKIAQLQLKNQRTNYCCKRFHCFCAPRYFKILIRVDSLLSQIIHFNIHTENNAKTEKTIYELLQDFQLSMYNFTQTSLVFKVHSAKSCGRM